MNKRVLVVAYLFPPIGGGGVQRTAKFVKYLPSYDWQPIILTVDEKQYSGDWGNYFDKDLLNDLPQNVNIYRTFSFDKIFKSGFGRIFRYLARLLFFADNQIISWLPFALKKGMEIVRRESIEIIYTTSVPYTNHFVGLLLKSLTGRPWVADFRDPWTSNLNYHYISPLHFIIDRYLESQIYRKCDLIITTTERYRSDLLNKFPFVKPTKVRVISNGFDPEDSNPLFNPYLDSKDKLHITYLAGTAYGDKCLLPFFQAIRLLIDSYPALASKIKINLIGEDPQKVQSLNVLSIPEEMISFVKYVPQRQVASYLAHSDILLVAFSKEFGCVPQKTYLYLAANKPILAIIPPGPTEDLLKETRTGVIVRPTEPKEIMQALYNLIRKIQANELQINPNLELIQSFSRLQTARRLADVLDEASLSKS